MSDTNITPTSTVPTPNDLSPQAAAAPVSEPVSKDVDAPAGSEKRVLADLARERKSRQELQAQLKELAPLAAKARELEDAQKSESERLNDQLAALKAEANTAKAEALRLRVAAETGLPADLQEFLVGDDEEQVRAQARKLMAATAAATDPRRPAPDPTQGAKQGGTGTDQLTRADLARMNPQEIRTAQDAGRFDDLMAGRI